MNNENTTPALILQDHIFVLVFPTNPIVFFIFLGLLYVSIAFLPGLSDIMHITDKLCVGSIF